MQSEWVYTTESLAGFVKNAKRQIIGITKQNITLKMIDKSKCNNIIIKNHYSHKTATDSHTLLHLGVFLDNELLGAMQYGYAMNPKSCSNLVEGTKINEYYELNRLWLNDKLPKNSESMVIGLSFKLIKKIRPKIKWIQSFADGRVGVGTIYQATNFLYCGYHTTNFIEFNNELHHEGKFSNYKKSFGRMYKGLQFKFKRYKFKQYRYIYFLQKKEKKNLLLSILSYPKKENKNNSIKLQKLCIVL